MSGTEDDAVSLPLSSGSSSTELLSDARSLSTMARGKHPWTHLENMELIRCYYEARAAGRGYQKRLKVIWDNKNLDMFRSQNNLACQARAIINSKLLTGHELRDVKQCAILTETDPPVVSHSVVLESPSLGEEALISSIPRSEELVDNVSDC